MYRKLILLIVGVVLFISACKPTPPTAKTLIAGQVTGVLYQPDGTRFSEGVSVFVGDVPDEQKKGSTISADLRHKTNSRGEFTIENVAPGRHALLIFIQPKPDNQTGTSIDPSSITMGVVVNKNDPVYFTMPAAAGMDLGNIEVTSILRIGL
jgi:hypothetical protein